MYRLITSPFDEILIDLPLPIVYEVVNRGTNFTILIKNREFKGSDESNIKFRLVTLQERGLIGSYTVNKILTLVGEAIRIDLNFTLDLIKKSQTFR